ncbi:MAG: hypothetical protein LUC91_02850, partial [Prevotella sp.]|nr:hypothetical protein [Prevotella sp.]
MDTETLRDSEAAFAISNSAEDPKIDGQQNYEECDYFTLVGIRDDDNENGFWESDNLPFLFITRMRLKDNSGSLEQIFAEIETQFNRNENPVRALCYYTLDSSDLVVAMRCDSYILGCAIIEYGYTKVVGICDPGNTVQKCFSVLSLKQELLDNYADCKAMDAFKDESVGVRLNCVINKWENPVGIYEYIDE